MCGGHDDRGHFKQVFRAHHSCSYYITNLSYTVANYHLCGLTATLLRRYFEHTGEISALDFDGERLCSGGKDGVINIYHTPSNTTVPTGGGVSDSSSDAKTSASASASTSTSTSSSSPTRASRRGRPRIFTESDIKFSDVLALEMMTVAETTTTTDTSSTTTTTATSDVKGKQQVVLESLHTKQVTGMRLVPSRKNNNNNNNNNTNSVPLPPPPSLMVTCGLDKKLVCVDVTTGATVYSVKLDATPTCLDVDAQVSDAPPVH